MKFNKKEIQNISDQLKNNKVGIFPFDTIWGITGIIDEKVVKKIRRLKNRPDDKPLLIVIPDASSLKFCVEGLADQQMELINDVWPGPVSIIFKKSKNIPYYVTGGKETVGIRLPDFEPLNYLLTCVGQPLVTTSANFSKQREPRVFQDIPKEIINKLDFVYDAFIPSLGEASRVIDCSTDQVKIVRA